MNNTRARLTLLKVIAMVFCCGCHAQVGHDEETGNNQASVRSQHLVSAAREAYEAAIVVYETTGQPNIDTIYLWSKRWSDAECSAHPGGQARILAIESHLARMKDVEKGNVAMHLASGGNPPPLQFTEYYVAEAEKLLEDARKASGGK